MTAFSEAIKQYQVVGRLIPTESQPSPPLVRMRLFAANKVIASSRFWYFLRKLKKIKKANGEILEIIEVKEKRPTYVKNFGVWLRYDSRTGTHNMYKEVRDLTQNGAISQIYAEMAGRHRARASSIQVIRIVQLKGSECRRPHTQQMLNSKLRLPAIRRIMPVPKAKRSTFCASRPKLFLH
ncbi:hypothetical protein Esti_004315 [Eimeria stiedai]